MPTTPANALDITAAGLVKFDGVVTFSGVTVTNHATLVGGASNGITSLGTGSSGQVLTSNGASADPSYQSLPSAACNFSAYLGSNDSNVTGDGTVYTVGTNVAMTKYFDAGTNFNTNGTFTAPTTGVYLLQSTVFFNNIQASHTSGEVFIIIAGTVSRIYEANACNPANLKDVSNLIQFQITAITNMTAGDTANVQVKIAGGTKVATLVGTVANSPQTWFSGYRIT